MTAPDRARTDRRGSSGWSRPTPRIRPAANSKRRAISPTRSTRIGLEVDLRRDRRRPANVVARLDNGAGPVFAFNSHIDVVPAGSGWTSDPFRLARRDGRLYARGACDAKGPIAGMLEAIEMLCCRARPLVGHAARRVRGGRGGREPRRARLRRRTAEDRPVHRRRADVQHGGDRAQGQHAAAGAGQGRPGAFRLAR